MRVEAVEYAVSGQRMIGQLAFDDSGDAPLSCVLVCHEAAGLSDNTKERAVRLARLGYLTFALDYVGGRVNPEVSQTTADAMRKDRSTIIGAARAGLQVLLSQDRADRARVAALGYCFGGAMAMELARDWSDLRAAIGIHPSMPNPAPDETRNILASVLLCCGGDDPYVPLHEVHGFAAELAEAGVRDWRVELYGGVQHSYTDPFADSYGAPGVAYDEAADRRSWKSAVELMESTIRPS